MDEVMHSTALFAICDIHSFIPVSQRRPYRGCYIPAATAKAKGGDNFVDGTRS